MQCGFPHPYQLKESITIVGMSGEHFHLYINLNCNSCEPDQTSSDLDLHCLSMSYENHTRLIWINK